MVINMLIKTMSPGNSSEEIVKRYNQAFKSCPEVPYSFFTIDGEASISANDFNFSRIYGAILCDIIGDISILYVSAIGKGVVTQIQTLTQRLYIEIDPYTGEPIEHTKDVLVYQDRVITEEVKSRMNLIVEKKILEYAQGRIM